MTAIKTKRKAAFRRNEVARQSHFLEDDDRYAVAHLQMWTRTSINGLLPSKGRLQGGRQYCRTSTTLTTRLKVMNLHPQTSRNRPPECAHQEVF